MRRYSPGSFAHTALWTRLKIAPTSLPTLSCPNPVSTPSASSNNKAVLEDIVKAIDAVARPNGPPLSTATAATAVVPPAVAFAAPAAPAAALTPPAPALATNVTAGGITKPSGEHGGGGTAVSEANGGAGGSRSSLVSDSGAVGAAGDDVVKGSDARPSSRGGGGSAPALGTRNDVLAAAAEVNGVGGDAGGASPRLAQGDGAPSAAEPVVAAAEWQREGTAGTKENDLVVAAVGAAERGTPPASMAEVGLKRGNRVWDSGGTVQRSTVLVSTGVPCLLLGHVYVTIEHSTS